MSSRKARDAVAFAAIATVFAVTLEMLRRVIGVASPWVGLMIMFDFVGLVAFARTLFTLRMPAILREPRAWETEGAIYMALRVPSFGELLRRSPLRFLNPAVYLSRSPDDPVAVLAQIESSEAAHAVAAVLIVPYIILSGMQGRWSAAAALVFVQIAFNLYPILHLRWVRIRLGRLAARRLRPTSPQQQECRGYDEQRQ